MKSKSKFFQLISVVIILFFLSENLRGQEIQSKNKLDNSTIKQNAYEEIDSDLEVLGISGSIDENNKRNDKLQFGSNLSSNLNWKPVENESAIRVGFSKTQNNTRKEDEKNDKGKISNQEEL